MGPLTQCANLIAQYKSLLQEIDPVYPLDKIILDNSASLFKCLESVQEALSTLYTTNWKNIELTPHSLSYDAFFSNEEEKSASIHDSIRKWRYQPSAENYATIPFNARKEIFDFFFREDVHGRLDNPDIMFLSRGTPEPLFFSPPNIVKAGIYIASEQNWFGYSDSLGHVETRQALAALEQQRRGIETISADNCAVILGGTLGLHAVLTMITKIDQRRKCVVLLPNYAPIVDDLNHLFEIRPVTLNTDFTVDMDQMEKTLRQPGVSACILSWPHNPASFKKAEHNLRKIMDICAEQSIYCIVDEIVFSAYSLSESDLENPYFISINSHSKTYNIPGLKLGHLLASKSFIERFYRHASTTYGSPLSFLYFCLTLLAVAETNARAKGMIAEYPIQVVPACSSLKILQEDFDVWRSTYDLIRHAQVAIVRHMLETFGFGDEEFFGIDDASPNFVLRCPLDMTSYEIMLNTVHDTNVSVFPVDCFMPPAGWPCDVRITYSVPPHQLATALAKVFRVIRSRQKMSIQQKSFIVGA